MMMVIMVGTMIINDDNIDGDKDNNFFVMVDIKFYCYFDKTFMLLTVLNVFKKGVYLFIRNNYN